MMIAPDGRRVQTEPALDGVFEKECEVCEQTATFVVESSNEVCTCCGVVIEQNEESQSPFKLPGILQTWIIARSSQSLLELSLI